MTPSRLSWWKAGLWAPAAVALSDRRGEPCGAELGTLVCWAGPAPARTSATSPERWAFLLCLSGPVTPSPSWSPLTRWQASVHEVWTADSKPELVPRVLRGAGFPSWCARGRHAGAGGPLSPVGAGETAWPLPVTLPPAGAAVPARCPPGTWSKQGNGAPGGCRDCSAGRLCSGGLSPAWPALCHPR